MQKQGDVYTPTYANNTNLMMNTASVWKVMVVVKNTTTKQIVVKFVQITTNWMETSAVKFLTMLGHLNARQFWSKIAQDGQKQMDVSPAALGIKRLDTFSSANVNPFDLIIYIPYNILYTQSFIIDLSNLSLQSLEYFLTQRICHTVLILINFLPF